MVGNATGNAFGSIEFADDSVSSLKCSSVGAAGFKTMGEGATKMVFSVFAKAACTKSAKRARSLMVVKKTETGGKHGQRFWCHSSAFFIITEALTPACNHTGNDRRYARLL